MDRYDSWLSDMGTPIGSEMPFGLGRVSSIDIRHPDVLATLEDHTMHKLHERIEEEQLQYIIEEAGVTHEYNGTDTLASVVNELRDVGFGVQNSDKQSTAIWLFHPKTVYHITDDIDEHYRRKPGEMHGYAIHSSTLMPENRFMLIDVSALAENPVKHQNPMEQYSPDDKFRIDIPRPWVVRDPLGIASIVYDKN